MPDADGQTPEDGYDEDLVVSRRKSHFITLWGGGQVKVQPGGGQVRVQRGGVRSESGGGQVRVQLGGGGQVSPAGGGGVSQPAGGVSILRPLAGGMPLAFTQEDFLVFEIKFIWYSRRNPYLS